MGYEDAVKYELKEKVDNLFDFFTTLLNQPANTELPIHSEWYIAHRISLESSVIGMKFIINLPNNSDLQLFAEAILSSIECFLATGISHKICPIISVVKCDLEIHSSVKKVTLSEEEDDYGNITYLIAIPEKKVLQLFQNKEDLDRLFEIVINIIGKNVINYDEIESMIVEDLAFNRMNQLLQLPNIIINIFGSDILGSIKEWEKAAGPERFSLMRIKPWFDNLHSNCFFARDETNTDDDIRTNYMSEGKHSDLAFISIINSRLWEKAEWKALLFDFNNKKPRELILGLVFGNEEAALKIFKGWNRLIENKDIKELIKISIITGTDKNHPPYYRVVIYPNLKVLKREDQKFFITNPQMNFMTPNNSNNLDNFQRFFSTGYGYYLAPAIITSESFPPNLADEKYWIKKNDINIIEAWKIQEHDIESIAITSDMDPIIPNNVKNAPVLSIINKNKTCNGRI
ncbi:MAG: hypothetical protein MUF15_19465 [Acidobacteria bacterium]|nr:hypothetical protein [Acidobacteriota bacterium]